MGKFYDAIPADLAEWIVKQEVFWVATAPLSAEGHVNISPKGLRGTFHVVNENKVWYQDVTGSGSETIAHVRENGRITILFNAFEGPARICRLFGKGRVHEFGTAEYDELIPISDRMPGSRAAVVIDVHKVGTSCGFGVPKYDFVAHRPLLVNMAHGLELKEQRFASAPDDETKPTAHPGTSGAPKALKAYWATENTRSIDGLPGFSTAYLSPAIPISGVPLESICVKADPDKRQRSDNVKTEGLVRSWSILHTRDEMRLILAFLLGVIVTATPSPSTSLTKPFAVMGKFYDTIPPNLVDWVLEQEVFWVATAPLSAEGHVNVSPKGLRGCFHIVNESRVWYQDLTGSGSETIAHLKENGRITILFSAFHGPPRIVRLSLNSPAHNQPTLHAGKVHEFGTAEYEELIPVAQRIPGSRSAVVIDVHKIGTSCGYGVPLYDFVGHRPTLPTWLGGLEAKEQRFASAIDKGSPAPGTSGAPGALKAYWALKNTKSIDGLPAFSTAYVTPTVPVAGVPVEVACAKAGPAKATMHANTVADGAIRLRTLLRAREEARLVVTLLLGIVIGTTYARMLGAC
ncbi:hypothetical protein OBBRIDRAFT_813699 [Obba rivulosa]|uniref:Pyridoxamine 5'-phosphate oxidase N-terminal domain-containing protein n=1 Tax=Obba rivulosa TaxID=1052685 RepID=A0A8E2DIU6_9APHY|nr:hypothetical protein OBBRIDRAFT_813699 [Obba rivulosa]